MPSEIDNTNINPRSGLVQEAEAFGGAFLDVFKRPVQGAAQLAGSGQPVAEHQQEQGWAANAGSMLGNATLFIGSQMLLSRIPLAGRVAPYLVGGGVGFLDPTRADQGIGTRISNSFLGAASIGMLEFSPRAMSASGLSWLPKTDLGRFALTSAVTGALNVQAESFINTGHAANAEETMLAGLTWVGTGAVAHGVARWATRPDTAPTGQSQPVDNDLSRTAPTTDSTGTSTSDHAARADLRAPILRQEPLPPAASAPAELTIPALQLGDASSYHHTTTVPTDAPLAKLQQRAIPAVSRIESINIAEGGQLTGGVATTFATRDPGGKLRFVSTSHLVDGAVDVTITDQIGDQHTADVLNRNPATDLSILRLRDPAAEARFQALDLSASQIDTTGDTTYVALGFAGGWDKLFVSEGRGAPSRRPAFESKLLLPGEEGLCGSPVCNLDTGQVEAIYKGASRGSNDVSLATPASHAITMVEKLAEHDPPRLPEPAHHAAVPFKIEDPAAASLNLQAIFGENFWHERPPDFYHSRALNLLFDRAGQQHSLTLRTQYRPRTNEVVVEPVAINGQPLKGDELWSQDLPAIFGARLTIGMNDRGLPTYMRSYNDPFNVLSQALARPQSAYLASLRPQT